MLMADIFLPYLLHSALDPLTPVSRFLSLSTATSKKGQKWEIEKVHFVKALFPLLTENTGSPKCTTCTNFINNSQLYFGSRAAAK